MNWNSHRIEEAISDCYKVSKAVAETQAAVKGHETRIKAILSGWSSKVIVERKTGQVYSLSPYTYLAMSTSANSSHASSEFSYLFKFHPLPRPLEFTSDSLINVAALLLLLGC